VIDFEVRDMLITIRDLKTDFMSCHLKIDLINRVSISLKSCAVHRVLDNNGSMDSDNEFNEFVMDEVVDSSSSDHKRKDIISGAAHIIVEDMCNHPGRIGSVLGHDVVDRERLFWHQLLFKDYFAEKPTFGPKIFRRRFVLLPRFVIMIFSYLFYKFS
jgi:hypothetical protein